MKQKKLSLGARFGLAVASFVLGILLFCSAVSAALVADMRVVTSGENMRGFIHQVISSPAHVRVNASVRPGECGLPLSSHAMRTYQMPRRDEFSGIGSQVTEKFISLLYDELNSSVGSLPITQEEFSDLVNQSTVKDYLVDKTAGLISDFFNGKVTTSFSSQEVRDLIDENTELIETVLGEPLPEEVIDRIVTAFDENELIKTVNSDGLPGVMQLLDFPDASPEEGSVAAAELPSGSLLDLFLAALNGDLPMSDTYFLMGYLLSAIQNFASIGNLIWSIVICLVFIAAIFFVNIRQIPKGLRRCGYPMMIAGSFLFVDLLAHFAPSIWEGHTVLQLLRYIFMSTTGVNATVFGLGLLFLVSGIVLGIVLRRKAAHTVVPGAAAVAESPFAWESNAPISSETEPHATETE